MTNPVLGSPPRGEDYFGQEDLIDSIWEKLKTDNILLVAPRRFGKTAAMYRLCDEPRESFIPVYTNLEHIRKAGDFMVELISKIYQKRKFKRIIHKLWSNSKKIADLMRSIPEDIDIGGFKVTIREKTDIPDNWYSYGERIMELLAREKPSLLLILDEFAVMIDEIAKSRFDEAKQLLRWFRAARIAPETKTRFVIGGSIHLIPTLDSIGLVDTINDLFNQKIKPFSLETATKYIEVIFQSRNISLPNDVKNEILDLVGVPIPYILAVFLTAIFDKQRAQKCKITKGLVKDVFQEDLLSGSTSATFHHYRSRINSYYLDWEKLTARTLLGKLSLTNDGFESKTLYQIFLNVNTLNHSIKTQEDFQHLMNKLDNDFYISSQDGKYDFFSRVLKLWWRTYYGFQGE